MNLGYEQQLAFDIPREMSSGLGKFRVPSLHAAWAFAEDLGSISSSKTRGHAAPCT